MFVICIVHTYDHPRKHDRTRTPPFPTQDNNYGLKSNDEALPLFVQVVRDVCVILTSDAAVAAFNWISKEEKKPVDAQQVLAQIERYPTIVIKDIDGDVDSEIGMADQDDKNGAFTICISTKLVSRLRTAKTNWGKTHAMQQLRSAIVHEFTHFYRREVLNAQWSDKSNTPREESLPSN